MDPSSRSASRRQFLAASGAALLLSGCRSLGLGPEDSGGLSGLDVETAIIDIHQHTHYHGRSDEDLVAHQRALGVHHTILLPAGSKYGLAADCGGNASVVRVAERYPGEFSFFANELPDLDSAKEEIERYLGQGAIGIGEQKFPVDCDSAPIEKIASIAREHRIPVLLHFQHEAYNLHFDRFHKVLEKFPEVDFIGHAQTWWGHIDLYHDPKVLYPKDKVTAGGLTDRYLADYPNMYGDLSAGSGLNSMLRDEDHARGFLDRHQDKLLFGSDCADTVGSGKECTGAEILAAIRRLSPSAEATRRILFSNAGRVLGRSART